MVYIIFLVFAALTVFTSMKLAKFGDIIERKSNLSAVAIGLLIGGATSLPEITSSITAVALDEPNLALANAYGSNFFNLLILAVLDLAFFRKRVYSTISNEQKDTGVLIIFMSVLAIIALYLKTPSTILGVSMNSIVMIIIYFIGIKVIERRKLMDGVVENEAEDIEEGGYTVRTAAIYFSFCAALIMLFGSVLTVTVDKIALLTGLGTSFVGGLFLAGATSLPEFIAGYTAMKLNNDRLLIGSIYGSNLFNLLIVIGTDLVYQKGSIFTAAHPSQIVTVFFSIILMAVSLLAASRRRTLTTGVYIVPSVITIVLYLVGTYLVYVLS